MPIALAIGNSKQQRELVSKGEMMNQPRHKQRARIQLLSFIAILLGFSQAFAGLPFFDGFEEGPWESNTNWFYDAHNWTGLKELTTTNPHSGTNCLHMRGADWEPGGCSHMRTNFDFGVNAASISFWIRDYSYLTGTGGPGYFNFNLQDTDGNNLVSFYENTNPALGSEYFQASGGDMIAAIGAPVVSNVILANIADSWIHMEVRYRSGSFPAVDVLMNGTEIITFESDVPTLPLGAMTIGVGGQYHNVGEIYIDDLSIEEIDPAVPVENTTWGGVKVLFRD